MSKRATVILLVVSLALNAGIIGGLLVYGILFANHNAHFNEQQPRPPAPGEMGRYDRQTMDTDSIRALRQEFRSTREELWQELAKDPVDEARVKTIMQRSMDAQIKLEKAIGDNLLDQRKKMSAAEAKEQFAERFARDDNNKNRRHP
jgi:hypothetical protein